MDRRELIKNKKLDYIIVFFVVVLLGILLRWKKEISITPEMLSMLSIPSKLAGYKWETAIFGMGSQGVGYFILFTPFLKFIHNSVVNYNIIIYGGIVTLGLSGVALEYIFNKILKHEDVYDNMVASVVGACFASHFVVIGFYNVESMVILLAIIVSICLVKYMCNEDKKSSIRWLILMCVLISYAMTVNIRNIVLLLGVWAIVLIKYIANWILPDKEQIKREMPLIIATIVVLMVFVTLIGKFDVLYYIDLSEISAAGFVVGTVQIILCNIYESIVHTYGLILVSYYYIGVETYRLINVVKNKDAKGYELSIDKILFWYSAVLYVGAMILLSMAGAGYISMTGNWSYYGGYATIMLGITLIRVLNEKELSLIIKFVMCDIIVHCSCYIYLKKEWIGKEYILKWFVIPGIEWGNDNVKMGFGLMIALSVMGVYAFTQKKEKYRCIYYLLCAYVVISVGNGGFIADMDNRSCEAGSKFVEYLDNNTEINVNKDLYYCGDSKRYCTQQFMLPDRVVNWNIENADKDNIFVIADHKNDEQYSRENGWYIFSIGDNEWVYVHNTELRKVVSDFRRQL